MKFEEKLKHYLLDLDKTNNYEYFKNNGKEFLQYNDFFIDYDRQINSKEYKLFVDKLIAQYQTNKEPAQDNTLYCHLFKNRNSIENTNFMEGILELKPTPQEYAQLYLTIFKVVPHINNTQDYYNLHVFLKHAPDSDSARMVFAQGQYYKENSGSFNLNGLFKLLSEELEKYQYTDNDFIAMMKAHRDSSSAFFHVMENNLIKMIIKNTTDSSRALNEILEIGDLMGSSNYDIPENYPVEPLPVNGWSLIKNYQMEDFIQARRVLEHYAYHIKPYCSQMGLKDVRISAETTKEDFISYLYVQSKNENKPDMELFCYVLDNVLAMYATHDNKDKFFNSDSFGKIVNDLLLYDRLNKKYGVKIDMDCPDEIIPLSSPKI
jgi:hypothetical protein